MITKVNKKVTKKDLPNGRSLDTEHPWHVQPVEKGE